MRAPVLAILVLVAGCGADADIVLELHRAETSSNYWMAVCDADTPTDCGDAFQERLAFDADTVHRVGIYVEDGLVPPLTVRLFQVSPATCRLVDIDPERERGLVVITFPTVIDGDLVVTDCPTCMQRSPCPN